MNDEDRKIYTKATTDAFYENTSDALVIGYLRYEAIRKLNPRQFAEIHARNLKGERFDDMIDELVIQNHKPHFHE